MHAMDILDSSCRHLSAIAYGLTHRDSVTEEASSVASDALLERHWRTETPLLLRGGASHWPALTNWTDSYLMSSTAGTIGVGSSRTTHFKTRSVNIVQMDAGEAFRTIATSSDPETRYYVKNIVLARSSLAPLAADLGTIRLLPLDALSPNRKTKPEALFWMGQRGTITPMHSDPAANVVILVRGEKKFTLASPAWSRHLYPESVTSPTFWYSQVGDIGRFNIKGDRGSFPKFSEVRLHTLNLRAGDALFIPAGWWHHVENLDTSISVNYFFSSPVTRRLSQQLTNPNLWHQTLAQLFDAVRVARFLRQGGVGPGAEQFDVYVNTLSVDALRRLFATYKRSWNPLYRWALSGYPDFESTPLYRRHKDRSSNRTPPRQSTSH